MRFDELDKGWKVLMGVMDRNVFVHERWNAFTDGGFVGNSGQVCETNGITWLTGSRSAV